MDITQKLGLWGTTHAQARSLETAARQAGARDERLQEQAQQLRQQADRLHREIYDEIGRPSDRAR
jgi:hypothetical protein